jgi:hypothetical protein
VRVLSPGAWRMLASPPACSPDWSVYGGRVTRVDVPRMQPAGSAQTDLALSVPQNRLNRQILISGTKNPDFFYRTGRPGRTVMVCQRVVVKTADNGTQAASRGVSFQLAELAGTWSRLPASWKLTPQLLESLRQLCWHPAAVKFTQPSQGGRSPVPALRSRPDCLR